MSCSSCNGSKKRISKKNIDSIGANFEKDVFTNTLFKKIIFFSFVMFLIFSINWYLNIPIIELLIGYFLFDGIFGRYFLKNKNKNKELS